VQGPVMLEALNMLEQMDVQGMGYNTPRYLHALYQVMNLAFADRDFYYGDPYYDPVEPIEGLLSKEYAAQRVQSINWEANDPNAGPGDPYPFEGQENPYKDLLNAWNSTRRIAGSMGMGMSDGEFPNYATYLGTTSVEAADAKGWVVSITPSGGWVPAVIAGNTGVGMSQRMQSFVLHPEENPFNVVEPGKRPRATLTPTLALKDGKPFLSFAVQGGDSQDQNSLQFFLNMVEWGMTVQEATEAANMNSYQQRNSFANHGIRPGVMVVRDDTPDYVRRSLKEMGYTIETEERTSGPLNAIYFDRAHGTMWGGSSNHGEDYGIGW